tara:strand:- start:35 stop:571 length:537 start_codon:yes stop_codon:yes gene_type:complete
MTNINEMRQRLAVIDIKARLGDITKYRRERKTQWKKDYPIYAIGEKIENLEIRKEKLGRDKEWIKILNDPEQSRRNRGNHWLEKNAERLVQLEKTNPEQKYIDMDKKLDKIKLQQEQMIAEHPTYVEDYEKISDQRSAERKAANKKLMEDTDARLERMKKEQEDTFKELGIERDEDEP